MADADASSRHRMSVEDIPYDLAYLFSAPLCDVRNPRMVIRSLDFQKEQAELFTTLRDSGKAVRLKIEVATSDKFVSVSTKGIRALHFSGHGQEHMLAFEDGLGRVHSVTPQHILSLLSAGRQADSIELVFVSACNSEMLGRAFAQAGVRHVIAVKRLERLADESARIFMNHFYLAALVGKTVRQAFDIAFHAVKTRVTDQNEPRKFLLLPEEGDHHKQIFRDVPRGEFVKIGEETPNNLPAFVENFLGRNIEMQQMVEKLADFGQSGRRLLHLTGPPRIGKSSLALETARYCLIRGMFAGGAVYILDFEEAVSGDAFPPAMSLAAFIAQELQLPLQNWNATLTGRQLAAYFKHKMHLLILDNVDTLLGAKPNGPRCLKTLILALEKVPIKLVITSRAPLDLSMHWPVEVKALEPQDSARLFFLSAARAMDPAEYGARINHDATQLGQHKILQRLEGNPGKLKFAAQRLVSGVQMEQLPEKIEPHLQSWEEFYAIRPIVDPDAVVVVLRIDDPEVRAQGSAVWMQAFGSSLQGTWDQLELVLAERFRAISPERRMSEADFLELKQYFQLQRINVDSFSVFWPWWVGWEYCVSKILSSWNARGVIQGPRSPQSAQTINDQLRGCKPGTFLLRPSNSKPGHLAVVFIEADGSKQQLLVDARGEGFRINLKDTGDRMYHTLPELILKCKKLRYLFPQCQDKETAFCTREEDMPH